jgi:hypothetical protein
MTDDRWERELAELLESGEPVRPLGTGARSRAVGAMQRSAAQGPPDSLLDRILGKGEKKMRRFAYAVAFLVLMGAAAAGVFTRSAPPDARSMLVSAVQAMEEAEVIHVRARPSTASPEGYPWGTMSDNTSESWYTPRGSRTESYDADGNLICSAEKDVAAGRVRQYGEFDLSFGIGRVFQVFHVERQHLQSVVAKARGRLLDGEGWLRFVPMPATRVTKRTATWNGTQVTLLQMDREMPDGDPLGTSEAYLDSQGRLVAYRFHGPPEYGRTLVSEMLVEYDVEPPDDLFAMQPPPDVPVTVDFAEPYPGPEVVEINYGSSFSPRYLIAPSAGWRADASSSAYSSGPAMAIDGDYGTRWTVRGRRHAQEAGMWFDVMFDAPVRANKLLVHNYRDRWAEASAPESAPVVGVSESEGGGMGGAGGGSSPTQVDESRVGTGWPVGAQVSITADGNTWEDVVTGQAATKIPLYANFGGVRDILGIRITLTETSDEEPWSIAEIGLFGPPSDGN